MRLIESRENPRHYEKVKWFCTYWDEYAESLKFFDRRIEGAFLA